MRVSAAAVVLLLWRGALPAAAADLSGDLVAAAARGDLAAVRGLLIQGADVNARSGGRRSGIFLREHGATPLCAAAAGGHSDVVEFLLESGADRFKTCRGRFLFWGLGDSGARGYTPLLVAAQKGNADIVRDLLHEPTAYALSDINHERAAMCRRAPCIDSVGLLVPTFYILVPGWRHRDNSLETAEIYGSTEVLRAIVEAVGPEAPLRAAETRGPGAALRTSPSVLLWASSRGDPDFVRWLLERGADPERADSSGRIALEVALDNGNAAAAVVIRSFMAREIAASQTAAPAAAPPLPPKDLESLVFNGDPYQSSNAVNDVAALEGSGDYSGALARLQQAVSETGLTLELAEEAAKAGAALQAGPPPDAAAKADAAEVLYHAARDEAGYESAVSAMAQVMQAAPWWGEGWRALSGMLDAADDEAGAVACLQIYLYSGPPAAQADAARARIQALRRKLVEEQGVPLQ